MIVDVEIQPDVRMEKVPASAAPFCTDPLLAWAVERAWEVPTPEALIAELGQLLDEVGIPVARLNVVLPTRHPQILGRSYRWMPGQPVMFRTSERSILNHAYFLDSPGRLIIEGAQEVRQRLRPGTNYEIGFFTELEAEGLTDYVAIALATTSSDTARNFISFATDGAEGFTEVDLGRLRLFTPFFARVIELHTTRRMAADLLDAYVGRDAGERILKGQFLRGGGETITAAVWFCDLRDFTGLSNRLPRDTVIELLNTFFEAMAGPVRKARGEILKFIGDAVLAIFPVRDGCSLETAANLALDAAFEASQTMADLNAKGAFPGVDRLRFGLALHLGDVMYGNVGAVDRLDFTAIGPAVNYVTRLERVAAERRYDIVVSGVFARACGALGDSRLISLGRYPMKGFEGSDEVFTLAP